MVCESDMCLGWVDSEGVEFGRQGIGVEYYLLENLPVDVKLAGVLCQNQNKLKLED